MACFAGPEEKWQDTFCVCKAVTTAKTEINWERWSPEK